RRRPRRAAPLVAYLVLVAAVVVTVVVVTGRVVILGRLHVLRGCDDVTVRADRAAAQLVRPRAVILGAVAERVLHQRPVGAAVGGEVLAEPVERSGAGLRRI